MFDKNMLWKRNIEKNIQNKHLIQERKLYEECIFEPQITKDPILLRSRSLKNDNMYNKNMEWKLKIETERISKAKENEEKLMTKSTVNNKTSRLYMNTSSVVNNKRNNESIVSKDFFTGVDGNLKYVFLLLILIFLTLTYISFTSLFPSLFLHKFLFNAFFLY